MSNFNSIFVNPTIKELPEEIFTFKDTVLQKHLIVGRVAFEELAQRYYTDKSVWVFTRNIDVYGWIQSNYKNRDWINIIANPADLPNELNYTVCGGAQTFALFADKITEAYSICDGPDTSPFSNMFKKSEIVLTKDEFSVIKYT